MIIVRLKGGMGNQMFQYALGRALSLKHKVPLKLDLSYLLDRTTRPGKDFTFREYDLGIFNIKADIADNKEIPFIFHPHLSGELKLLLRALVGRFVPNKGRERSFHFDPAILSLGPDVYLEGYFQSPKYFSSIESVIRKDFTLKKSLDGDAKNLLEEIKAKDSLCIHVRRGDFVGNARHGVMDQNYYNSGIEYVASKGKIEKIYVFSDDIEWCKNNLKFLYPVMFVGSEYAGEKASGHLELMKACKNFIISNSTFSWWGAWLAENPNKIVIAPKAWFKNGQTDTSDLIPKEWIRI